MLSRPASAEIALADEMASYSHLPGWHILYSRVATRRNDGQLHRPIQSENSRAARCAPQTSIWAIEP